MPNRKTKSEPRDSIEEILTDMPEDREAIEEEKLNVEAMEESFEHQETDLLGRLEEAIRKDVTYNLVGVSLRVKMLLDSIKDLRGLDDEICPRILAKVTTGEENV